jgi:predicted nucleic acid-binding Zn finger protein
MKTIKIETEKDYLKLKHVPFNREYGCRADLQASMHKYGFIGEIILIETDVWGEMNIYIADGQNRAATAASMGIPFYGVVCDIKFKSQAEVVQFIASRNCTQKAWTPANYVKAYAYLGREDYVLLTKLAQTSTFTMSVIAALLMNLRGGVKKQIQNGTFKCTFLQETKACLAFASLLSKEGQLSCRMLKALSQVMLLKKFDPIVFQKKYAENYSRIKELRLDDYSVEFESWVN